MTNRFAVYLLSINEFENKKKKNKKSTHKTNTLYSYETILWLELIVKVEKNIFHSDLIVLYKNNIILISINKIQNEINFSFFHLFISAGFYIKI